jgi:hypothetical protein
MNHYQTEINVSNSEQLKQFILDLYSASKENNSMLARGEMISTYNIKKDLHLNPLFEEVKNQVEYHLEKAYGRHLEITEMWSNVSKKGGSLGRHTHEPNIAVGVYYLQAEKNCGNLILNMVDEVEIITNSLIIFDGNVLHKTMSNESNIDRIVIGFIAN